MATLYEEGLVELLPRENGERMEKQQSKYGRLSRQLVVWFLICGLLPMMVVSVISYNAIRSGLIEKVAAELHTTAKDKVEFINNWFDYRWMDLNNLAQDQNTIDLLMQLQEVYSASGLNISDFVATDKWQEISDWLGTSLHVTWRSYDYIYDLFLIDTDGNVLYSVVKEDDLGTNLLTGKYSRTRFAESVRVSLESEQKQFSDFEFYGPSNDLLSGFLSTPVYDANNELLGVVAVQLRLDRINKILTSQIENKSYHYIVGQDRSIRTAIEDKNEVLKRKINSPIIDDWLLHSEVKHLQSTEAGIGYQEYKGGKGNIVFGYLHPIKIYNVHWALVSESDRDAALAKATWLSNYELVLWLLTAIIVTLLSIQLARRISRPVLELVDASEAMMGGDLDQKVISNSNNEIGKLADVFNLMVEARKRYEEALLNKSEENRVLLEQLKEERYALSQHAIVAITDIKGTITYVNSKFTEISGYSEQELLGENHRLLNSGYHPKEFFRDMYLTISSGQIWSGEICNRAKDGHLYWVHTTIAPFTDASGIIDHYIAIRTDITEQKQIVLELEGAKQAAEQATIAKSEFLASMSHEIRTPMNGVLGMLGLLMRSQLTSDQKHQAKLALSSAESLLVLINDILDFSKIEAGKLRIEVLDFDLATMLGEFAEAMAERAQSKGVEVMLDLAGINKTMVRGDPSRLRQIFTNLVSNAIKFTAEGEIVIQVDLIETKPGLLKLQASVSDTGIGISLEKLEHIFESFTQVDASTTRQYGGTGLGLSIVKQLCLAMGGDVKVQSKLGEGSCFQFEVTLETSSQSKLLMPSVDVQGLPMLVVDDNATNREVLRRQLQLWGAVVTEASSGQDALATLEQRSGAGGDAGFVVAFLDYQMPEMDGASLGQVIRSNPLYDPIKLIMMTSISNRGDAAVFAEIGFDGYFPKPATTSDLFNALAVLITGGEVLDSAKPLVTRHYLQSLEMAGEDNQAELQADGRWPENTRLLLVEDNKINQAVALGLLEDLGLHCETANNGLEALSKLNDAQSHHPYTLILMDCQMPGMDGYEATRSIRQGEVGERYANIPIIAMTANAMKGDMERCLTAGMDDYMSKPINYNVLNEKLSLWILNSEQRDGLQEQDIDPSRHKGITWDRDSLLKRVGGKPERAKILIGMFLDQAPGYLIKMEQAISRENPVELAETMHALKGISANLGAQHLMQVSATIEMAAKSEQWDLIHSNTQSAKDQYDQLQKQLANYLSS